MANTSQTPTHLAHSMSAPTHNNHLTTTPGVVPRPLTTSPRLVTLAQSGQNPAAQLRKNYLAPTIELTGAAAAAENARHRQRDLDSQHAPPTSRNPQNVFGNGNPFMSSSSQQPMSRPTDAPSSKPEPSNQNPPPRNDAQDLQNNVSQGGRARFADNPVERPVARSSVQSRSPRQPNGDQDIYASPEPADRQTQPPQATAGSNTRKRVHSATPPNASPTYGSTYPPISSSAPANRNASLPNSGANKSPAKKHKCPHCDTEFTRHHNLKSHLLTHSQEKPFACDQCDARFRRLHDLKRHVKLHTGERPHTCDVCGRAFARGDALARHNKGPGGCAGRRESNIGDGDEDMDGEGDEEGEEQDAEAEGQRRKSEPHKRARMGSGRPSLSQSKQLSHGRSYPPVAPMIVQSPSQLQPPQQPYYATTSANRTSNTSRPQNLSPHPSHTPMQGFAAPQYQTPSIYAQGSVMDSPRPLSPGQPEPSHTQSDISMGGRSPSISTRMQQQHMIRGSIGGSGTPSNSIPTPQQRLPSMQIDSRYGQSLPPPSISTQAPSGNHSGPPSAGPTSGSSHHQSNSGSIREMYNAHAQQQQQQQQSMSHSASATGTNNEQSLYTIIADLTTSLKRKGAECDDVRLQLRMLQEQHGQAVEEYQHMAQENHMLRSQLHGQQGR